MKKHIEPFACAEAICNALPKGILLNVKNGDKLNPMTIGWGTIGIQWGKPIFIAFVRECRYTKTLLDQAEEFTVSIPTADTDHNIFRFCGTKSGREVDKMAALGLHEEAPEVIGTPGIQEVPLTLECSILYRQKQRIEALDPAITAKYYPHEPLDSDRAPGADVHTAYYGQIVSAYLIEKEAEV